MSPLLVSIIIPCYNVSEFIDDCLTSVLNQSYKNLQVICVNDGSTDDTLVKLNCRAQNDSRMEVITIPNGGLSNTRNVGMSHARGDYLMFIDGDDWWDLDLVKRCVESATKHTADVVMFPYISEHHNSSLRRDLFKTERLFEGNELKRLSRRIIGPVGHELRNPARLDSFGSACFKLYRTSIAKLFKFVDLKIIGTAEDSLYNMQLYPQCSVVTYIPDCYYHYRKTNTNQLTKKNKPNLWNQLNNLYHLIEDIPTCDNEALNNRISLNIVAIGLNELDAKVSLNETRKRIQAVLSSTTYSNAVRQLVLSYFPVHWRVFFFCAKHRQTWPLLMLLKIIHKIINR